MITQEQFQSILSEMVRERFWPTKPPLQNIESNANTLIINFSTLNDAFGRLPNAREAEALIRLLGDVRKGGQLAYHEAGEGDPADNLPHQDITALRNIRNMTDVRRVLNLPPEQLRHFAHLTPTSKAFEEFNARIQFIKEHNITGSDSLGTTAEKTDNDVAYQRLLDRIARITPRDCGASSTQPGQNPWAKVNRFKVRLNEVVEANKKRGVDPVEVAEYIEAEVNKFSDSGVR